MEPRCELAQALRDGVLLCQLLNNLLPHAINLREVNLRPQMSQVETGHRQACRRVGGGRAPQAGTRRLMHCTSGPAVKRGGWPPTLGLAWGICEGPNTEDSGCLKVNRKWVPMSRLKTGKLGVNPSPNSG